MQSVQAHIFDDHSPALLRKLSQRSASKDTCAAQTQDPNRSFHEFEISKSKVQ